jgi:hypothetical protein
MGRQAPWTCGWKPFAYFTTSGRAQAAWISLMRWGVCQVAGDAC